MNKWLKREYNSFSALHLLCLNHSFVLLHESLDPCHSCDLNKFSSPFFLPNSTTFSFLRFSFKMFIGIHLYFWRHVGLFFFSALEVKGLGLQQYIGWNGISDWLTRIVADWIYWLMIFAKHSKPWLIPNYFIFYKIWFYNWTFISDLNRNWQDETYVEANGGVFAECTFVMYCELSNPQCQSTS